MGKFGQRSFVIIVVMALVISNLHQLGLVFFQLCQLRTITIIADGSNI